MVDTLVGTNALLIQTVICSSCVDQMVVNQQQEVEDEANKEDTPIWAKEIQAVEMAMVKEPANISFKSFKWQNHHQCWNNQRMNKDAREAKNNAALTKSAKTLNGVGILMKSHSR